MSAGDIYTVLSRPVVTEKTTIQKEDNNQISFRVRVDANKIEIRKAVEKLLGVKVTAVNTLITRGKTRRMGRQTGRRSNWKKAFVRLSEGDSLNFYEQQ